MHFLKVCKNVSKLSLFFFEKIAENHNWSLFSSRDDILLFNQNFNSTTSQSKSTNISKEGTKIFSDTREWLRIFRLVGRALMKIVKNCKNYFILLFIRQKSGGAVAHPAPPLTHSLTLPILKVVSTTCKLFSSTPLHKTAASFTP